MKRLTFVPAVVVLYAPPYHGKTTFGKMLADCSNFVSLDNDHVKRELFPDVPEPKYGDPAFTSKENTERTTAAYVTLADRAAANFVRGIPTVLSGTFYMDAWKLPLIEKVKAGILPLNRVKICNLHIGSLDVIECRIRSRNKERSRTDDNIVNQLKAYTNRKPMPAWTFLQIIKLNCERGQPQVMGELLHHLAPFLKK